MYGFSILRNCPESSTVQINIKVNQTKGQSRIDNSDKLAALGTQDAGRRQTKAKQNKTKQTHKIKRKHTHTAQKTKKIDITTRVV